MYAALSSSGSSAKGRYQYSNLRKGRKQCSQSKVSSFVLEKHSAMHLHNQAQPSVPSVTEGDHARRQERRTMATPRALVLSPRAAPAELQGINHRPFSCFLLHSVVKLAFRTAAVQSSVFGARGSSTTVPSSRFLKPSDKKMPLMPLLSHTSV